LLFWQSGMHEIDEYFPAVADSLMSGCLLAFFQDSMRKKFLWLARPEVFALLGLLIVFSSYLLPWVRLQIFFGGLVPITIALFLLSAIERADVFINNRVTSFFGVLSYSLYLWQQPFLNKHSSAWWTVFPLNVLLAVICAIGSYYFVERPFLGMFRSQKAQAVAVP
jgi:peptidoglycan/LPS O-acetylase OafA/YrhL